MIYFTSISGGNHSIIPLISYLPQPKSIYNETEDGSEEEGKWLAMEEEEMMGNWMK